MVGWDWGAPANQQVAGEWTSEAALTLVDPNGGRFADLTKNPQKEDIFEDLTRTHLVGHFWVIHTL